MTLPIPEAERVRLSAYPVQVVIEAIVKGKFQLCSHKAALGEEQSWFWFL